MCTASMPSLQRVVHRHWRVNICTVPNAVVDLMVNDLAPCYIGLKWSAPGNAPVTQYVLTVYQDTACIHQVTIGPSSQPMSTPAFSTESSMLPSAVTNSYNLKIEYSNHDFTCVMCCIMNSTICIHAIDNIFSSVFIVCLCFSPAQLHAYCCSASIQDVLSSKDFIIFIVTITATGSSMVTQPNVKVSFF